MWILKVYHGAGVLQWDTPRRHLAAWIYHKVCVCVCFAQVGPPSVMSQRRRVSERLENKEPKQKL